MSERSITRVELINLADEFTEELTELFLALGKGISKNDLDSIHKWFRYHYRKTNNLNETRRLTAQEARNVLGLTSADKFPVPHKRRYEVSVKSLQDLLTQKLGELDFSKPHPSTLQQSNTTSIGLSKLTREEIAERLDVLRQHNTAEQKSFSVELKNTSKNYSPYYDPLWKPLGHLEELPVGNENGFYDDHLPKMASYTVTVRDARQQKSFSDLVYENCFGTCLISGFTDRRVLDAAHINEVKKNGSMHYTNGLILRADLHRAFDKSIIGINPYKLTIHSKVSDYQSFEGNELKPTKTAINIEALIERWEIFNEP
ncbi:HNH endonuclease [Buttiauxella sp.]|uniref:HNH endonuclease n=1 Tax=Buttiauxella sp. TaxID=1972222 RepID=UPI003C756A6B